jgi:hypothetical protein
MPRRKKKDKRKNIANKIYQIVDIVGIDEKELIPVGELYAYRGVYLMVPYGREMKISKGKKIPTYGEVHPYQDLNEIREELNDVRRELKEYKRKEEERWINLLGNEMKKLENDPPNDNSNQKEPLIYQIIDKRIKEEFDKLREELSSQIREEFNKLKEELFSQIREIVQSIQAQPIVTSIPQAAQTLGEKVYTSTQPQPYPTTSQTIPQVEKPEEFPLWKPPDQFETPEEIYKKISSNEPITEEDAQEFEYTLNAVYFDLGKFENEETVKRLLARYLEYERKNRGDPRLYLPLIYAAGGLEVELTQEEKELLEWWKYKIHKEW